MSKDKPLTFEEPLQDETNKAFEYFQEYLKMGINRSFKAVAEKYNISLNAVKKFAHRFFWTERVRLYNSHIAQTYKKEMEDEARKVNKRHLQQAKIILDKSLKKINKIKPENLTPDQALKFFEFSVKMERDALGMENLLQPNQINFYDNRSNNLTINYSEEEIKSIDESLYLDQEDEEE